MLHVPKTKRLGPPTEALGYPRQPARISKGNIVARIIQSVIEIKNDGTSTRPQPNDPQSAHPGGSRGGQSSLLPTLRGRRKEQLDSVGVQVLEVPVG
jgi:hypothetical protein